MKIEINPLLCKECHNCIAICPVKIYQKDANGRTLVDLNRIELCLVCGQCMAICQSKAIEVEGLSYHEHFFELPPNPIDYTMFHDFVANRRSVRVFKNQPVPNEIFDKVLDILAMAPYGAAPDNVDITIINNRKIIEEALPHISKFLNKIDGFIRNPFMNFFMKRKLNAEKYNTVVNHLLPRIRKHQYDYTPDNDRITRHAPALMIFHAPYPTEAHTQDSLIYCVMANFAVMSLGLGATIVELLPPAINKVKEVRDIFKIPDTNEAVISLIVGYPKFHFRRGIKREKTHVTKL